MSELHSTFATAIGIVVAYLFLPPALIYSTQRFRRNMRILQFNPQKMLGSEKITKFFDDSIEVMEEIGFECLGEFSLPDITPAAKAIVQLYRNVATRETATVNTVWGVVDGIATQRVNYTEFICRFEHDEIQMVQTNNLSRPGSFPDNPLAKTFRLPQITDTRDLYHCHQRLMKRDAPRARRVLRVDDEFDGDAESFLRQVILIESFDRQTTTGYLKAISEGWAPTVYGALMMTWKELWPFKQIRTIKLRFRGAKVLAELQDEFGPLPD